MFWENWESLSNDCPMVLATLGVTGRWRLHEEAHTENCELDSDGGGNVATALKGAAQNFSEKNVWDQNNTRPQKNIWKPLG